VKLFRVGLIFKAHRPVYHSILGSSVIKKKKKTLRAGGLKQEQSKRPAIPTARLLMYDLRSID
jgi:hypothetical protein